MWWIVDKFISKKLLVFIVSTAALFQDKLDGEAWTYLALVYLGVQGLIDYKAKPAVTQQKKEDKVNDELPSDIG